MSEETSEAQMLIGLWAAQREEPNVVPSSISCMASPYVFPSIVYATAGIAAPTRSHRDNFVTLIDPWLQCGLANWQSATNMGEGP